MAFDSTTIWLIVIAASVLLSYYTKLSQWTVALLCASIGYLAWMINAGIWDWLGFLLTGWLTLLGWLGTSYAVSWMTRTIKGGRK
jgi:hypothetical protein